jgi:hypothetical protein
MRLLSRKHSTKTGLRWQRKEKLEALRRQAPPLATGGEKEGFEIKAVWISSPALIFPGPETWAPRDSRFLHL